MKRLSRMQGWNAILTALIIAGSCVRMFLCLQHDPTQSLFSDPMRHWLNGIHFPYGGFIGASDPILYQAYVAVLRVVTGDKPILVGLVSGLLSVFMPWPYYRAARDFGLQKIPALSLWALIVWNPSLFAIYRYIMPETLLLVVDGVALWMTARYLRKGGTRNFLISVFFWTLACLTKSSVLPLAAVCLLWSWWKKSPPLRTVAVGAGLALLLILPQAIRSKMKLGFIAPFGNSWLVKIQHRSDKKSIHIYFQDGSYFEFGSPSAYTKPLWPFSDWVMRRAAGDSRINVYINLKNGSRDWKNAYDGLNIGWAEWLVELRENLVLFLFGYSWPDGHPHTWDAMLTYNLRWTWAPIIVFILVWNFREFLRHHFELVPVAVTVFTLFLAFQNVVTMEGRYRKPVEPLLLLNLVWALSSKSMNRSSGEPSHSDAPDVAQIR